MDGKDVAFEMKYIPAYVEKKQKDESTTKDEVFTFVLTKEIEDRAGDIVRIDGLRTENYMKNPVVLFNHSKENLPVGKAIKISKYKDSLLVDIVFAKTEMGMTIKQLVMDGILNAVSIGFLPITVKPLEKGLEILEAELLEVSIVNIPANPMALLQKYIDNQRLYLSSTSDGITAVEQRYQKVLDRLKQLKHKILSGGIYDGRENL